MRVRMMYPILGAFTLILSAATCPARGAALIINPGNGGTAGPTPGERTGFTGNLGYQFTVGPDPITITALGMYDGGAAGLSQTHTISLYLASNFTTAIATATVDSSTPGSAANFIYAPAFAVPVPLAANTAYVLLTNFTSGAGNDAFLDLDDGAEPQGLGAGGNESEDTGARFTTSAKDFVGKVGFGAGNTVSGYGGPNAQFTVPEPATLALAAVGLSPLLRRRPRPVRGKSQGRAAMTQ